MILKVAYFANVRTYMNEELKWHVISRLKEYALIGMQRRVLLDELKGMNLYDPTTSQLKASPRAKNRKKDLSDLLVIRDDKRMSYMAVNEAYVKCCNYIYDLPINEKGINFLIRYMHGKIKAPRMWLNKWSEEIIKECQDIDTYLPRKVK